MTYKLLTNKFQEQPDDGLWFLDAWEFDTACEKATDVPRGMKGLSWRNRKQRFRARATANSALEAFASETAANWSASVDYGVRCLATMEIYTLTFNEGHDYEKLGKQILTIDEKKNELTPTNKGTVGRWARKGKVLRDEQELVKMKRKYAAFQHDKREPDSSLIAEIEDLENSIKNITGNEASLPKYDTAVQILSTFRGFSKKVIRELGAEYAMAKSIRELTDTMVPILKERRRQLGEERVKVFPKMPQALLIFLQGSERRMELLLRLLSFCNYTVIEAMLDDHHDDATAAGNELKDFLERNTVSLDDDTFSCCPIEISLAVNWLLLVASPNNAIASSELISGVMSDGI